MKDTVKFYKDLMGIVFKNGKIEAILLVCVVILCGIAPALQMVFIGLFLDKSVNILNGSAMYGEIFYPITLVISVIALNAIISKLSNFVAVKLELKLKEKYRTSITEKIAKLEFKHIENQESWDLIFRVSDKPEEKIRAAYSSFLSMIELIIRVLSVLLVLSSYSWWAVIVILAIAIPLFYMAIKSGKVIYQVEKDVSKARRESHYIGAVLTDREHVNERLLFGYGDTLGQKWLSIFEKVRMLEFDAQKKWTIKSKIGGASTALISILVLLMFLKPLSVGEITIGVFISIGYGIIELINQMSWRVTNTLQEQASNKEYFSDIRKFFELKTQTGALSIPRNDIKFESLEFRNVSFKYPGTENYIFKNLSFKIESGKHYAIVGSNGSGKTTITKLITGLYDNFEGEILINGLEIGKYDVASLKGITSVVYQDFARYQISLRDNIAIGNTNFLENKSFDKEVSNAIQIMELSEKVESLPEEMYTELGKLKKNGMDLSGGQWQRIAMARSIVSGATLRILDEPTSALDPLSESKVYENFEKISKEKTTIFISHRLGSTKLADEILVIDNGCLVENGSHDNLMKQGGVYARMYDSQREWYAC